MFVYYYNLLNLNQKRIYDSILKAASKFSKQASFHGSLNNNDLSAAVTAFQNDHPEAFFMDFSKGVSGRSSFSAKSVSFNFSLSEKEYKQTMNAINKVIAALANAVKKFKDDYDKLLFIHDYLATSVTYDLNAKNPYDASGPLVNKSGVCQGISHATKMILDAIGIDCIIVRGNVHSSITNGLHAWNIVKINGRWYHLDVTLDLKQNMTHFHTYFLLNDDDIKVNHSLIDYVDIQCKYLNDNYFFRNKAFFADLDLAAKYILKEIETKTLVEVKLLKVDSATAMKNLMNALSRNSTKMVNFFVAPSDGLNVFAIYRK